jgi:holo-[acyl-carrier protein] synthase
VIVGIGTDIVGVARMARNVERFGERFAQRILTEDELVEYRQTGGKAQFLAKRFAAKEAAVKAMGTGFRHGVSPNQIGVAHESGGRPILVFRGTARDYLDELGVSAAHLSISDERESAVAFVALERQES